ncbi:MULTISPECIES: hypothetical protein, partial [Blautia]|uniref:hypothetical protein n=1 Tax=Blautia TaxID=572511 RepID=UPI00197ACA82
VTNECKRIFDSCVSLFSYQGSCQFLTALIFYHISFGLSRTFLSFFKLFFVVSLFEGLPAIGCCRFATAILDYHIFSDLSTTFLTFFIIFGSFCSILRKLVTNCFHIAFNSNSDMLSHISLSVNNFFNFFFTVKKEKENGEGGI